VHFKCGSAISRKCVINMMNFCYQFARVALHFLWRSTIDCLLIALSGIVMPIIVWTRSEATTAALTVIHIWVLWWGSLFVYTCWSQVHLWKSSAFFMVEVRYLLSLISLVFLFSPCFFDDYKKNVWQLLFLKILFTKWQNFATKKITASWSWSLNISKKRPHLRGWWRSV
jgi:hypothetical protein